MRQSIEINGKSYKVQELDFNNVCKMEEMDAPLEKMDTCTMTYMRAYAAICMGVDADTAGAEIQAHIIAGNNLKELYSTLQEVLADSGFFQAVLAMAETETPAVEEKPKSKK